MSKRYGKLPKRLRKKLVKEKKQIKDYRLKIIQDLGGACIYGGNLSEIRKLVVINNYTKEELEEAINILRSSCGSGLEVHISKESISFLENYIRGKTK